jgi:hypothetical protein
MGEAPFARNVWRFSVLKDRIASLLARCATKANPAKAGDAKPRG